MSWNISKLGEECKIFSGNSINAKTKENLYTNVEGTPYIATKDITYDGNINYLNGISIPEEDQDKFKKAKSECVFICSEGGSAGRKIAFSDTECFFVNKLFCLEAGSNLLPKYIYYYLRSKAFQIQFKNALTGLIGGVSLSKIKLFDITYPSLQAQKQIVEKLDTAFADIDKAISATEKNIDNAEALFRKFRDNLFELDKLGDDTGNPGFLEEVLSNQPRNGYSPPKNYQNSQGTPLLTLSAVTGNTFKYDKRKFTQAPLNADAHYWIENGDLLITRSNTRDLVGHVALVKDIQSPTIYSDLIMKMRVDEKRASGRFMYHQLQTSNIRKYIMDNAKGANPTMVKINQQVVKKIPVIIPSQEKQDLLVNKIEEFSCFTIALKKSLNTKMSNLLALKIAFLNEAFSGELTKVAA